MTTSDAPRYEELQAALAAVAVQGLASAFYEDVECVARAIWHGDLVPRLDGLQGPHAAEAALLVERLSFYNLVPQARKQVLRACLGRLLEPVSAPGRAAVEQAYKRFLPRLQPLQSRHQDSRPPAASG